MLDPVAGVGAEARVHARGRSLRRPAAAQVAFVDQVLQAETLAGVAAGDVDDEAQVGAHHAVAGFAVAVLDAVGELLLFVRRQERRLIDFAQDRVSSGDCTVSPRCLCGLGMDVGLAGEGISFSDFTAYVVGGARPRMTGGDRRLQGVRPPASETLRRAPAPRGRGESAAGPSARDPDRAAGSARRLDPRARAREA